MKYRYLGRSGLLVSRLCLGTMTFGNKDWGSDLEGSRAVVKTFIDGGGNFIDTADAYVAGESENILATILKDYKRDDLVIATKGWFPTGGAMTARGSSRKHIVEACEASLKRLNTDYVDLWQFHGPDPYTPIEETLAAADDLVRSGKARYIGCSNYLGWQISRAQGVARHEGLTPMISAQHLYNLVRRDIERDVLPACDAEGLGMICWSPLAAGMLSGKYRGQTKPAEGSRHAIQANLVVDRYWIEGSERMIETVIEVAKRLGRTPTEIALSWLFGDRRVTAAIVGSRSAEQLSQNMGAGDFDLPSDVRQELTDVMPLKLGYPHEWIAVNAPSGLDKAEFQPAHKLNY